MRWLAARADKQGRASPFGRCSGERREYRAEFGSGRVWYGALLVGADGPIQQWRKRSAWDKAASFCFGLEQNIQAGRDCGPDMAHMVFIEPPPRPGISLGRGGARRNPSGSAQRLRAGGDGGRGDWRVLKDRAHLRFARRTADFVRAGMIVRRHRQAGRGPAGACWQVTLPAWCFRDRRRRIHHGFDNRLGGRQIAIADYLGGKMRRSKRLVREFLSRYRVSACCGFSLTIGLFYPDRLLAFRAREGRRAGEAGEACSDNDAIRFFQREVS